MKLLQPYSHAEPIQLLHSYLSFPVLLLRLHIPAKKESADSTNNATTNSNVTFGSINFNVASMSSAADGKKALDVFVQGANDMMAKKGIGTKLNINMK